MVQHHQVNNGCCNKLHYLLHFCIYVKISKKLIWVLSKIPNSKQPVPFLPIQLSIKRTPTLSIHAESQIVVSMNLTSVCVSVCVYTWLFMCGSEMHEGLAALRTAACHSESICICARQKKQRSKRRGKKKTEGKQRRIKEMQMEGIKRVRQGKEV